MMKIGFIGGGKMAEAIIAALLRARHVGAGELFASDVTADRRRHLKRAYGINVYSKNAPVTGAADVVFLCVKPQSLDEVLEDLSDQLTRSHLVISIVAGKRLDMLQFAMPMARVIRVMPNLPALVAAGMTAFCCGTRVTQADRRTASKIFACFGEVLELPEDQFDAVTALSGSGPAFFARFLELMVGAGVAEGLSHEHALLLARQTMFGTSRLLIDQGMDPRDLVESVATAKGTTAAGLKVLDRSALAGTLEKMIRAAAKRSKELSS